jgi:hypothetical protein
MANQLLTISKITNEALMVLENELTFSGNVNREYDPQFAVNGAKIGNTLNVRKPARFIGTSGPALNVEDFYESSVPVVLGVPASYGDQFHVDTQFTTQDLALSLDNFSDRVLKPAIAAIGNRIDYVGLTMAKNTVANIVGTAGSPASALSTYLSAQAYLDSEAAPRDGKRTVTIDPFTNAAIVDSLKTLFNPTNKIGDQYRKGMMGTDSAGLNWFMDQNVVTQNFGTWSGAGSTVSANTTGAFTGSISTGWASTATITLTTVAQTLSLQVGDTFTIAGVYAVNPQNRQSYGKLRNFVVTAAAAVGTGGTAVTISPAIITAGQFQNVVVTSTSATAAVTPFSAGASGVSVASPQSIMMHRNAFTLATADLEVPKGVDFAGRASSKDSGLSIRIVRQYTIANDAIPTRLDVLFGWASLYPELACRVAS